MIGVTQRDYIKFKEAVLLLSKENIDDQDFEAVLNLREQMNNGGKRKYSKTRILRDYTPNSRKRDDDIVRSS